MKLSPVVPVVVVRKNVVLDIFGGHIWNGCIPDGEPNECGLVCKGFINQGPFEGRDPQRGVTPCSLVTCTCGLFVE